MGEPAAKEIVLELPEMTLWYHHDKRIVHHHMHAHAVALVIDIATCFADTARASGWRTIAAAVRCITTGWPTSGARRRPRRADRAPYASLGVTANVFADPFAALAWLVQCPD